MAVRVSVTDGVLVGVLVGVDVGVGVGVGVGVAVGVGVNVGVRVGVRLGTLVGVSVGGGDAVAVHVAVAVDPTATDVAAGEDVQATSSKTTKDGKIALQQDNDFMTCPSLPPDLPHYFAGGYCGSLSAVQ